MKRQHVLGVIALFLLLAIDQGSKYLAVHFLQGHPDVILIPGVFQLEYLENRGAAFGILQNQRVLLLIVTLIIFGGLCYFYCKMGSGRKWRPLQSAIVLIAAGAVSYTHLQLHMFAYFRFRLGNLRKRWMSLKIYMKY